METNEALKMVLVQAVEAEVVQLLKRVQELKTGDLKGVEQEVLTSMFAIGRTTLERLIQAQAETVAGPARREGACGHEQRLVSQRPKQVLTLVGKITIHRAYYQCLNPTEEHERDGKRPCTHGEAPADALWGITERHTSAGVRASGELSGSRAHPGGNGNGIQSTVPASDVRAASAAFDAAGGRSAGGSRASAGAGRVGRSRAETHDPQPPGRLARRGH